MEAENGKKTYTFNSPYYQNFSLPRDTINSIITNPISSKGFQKLIQTCKYFFSKNSAVVIDKAKFSENLFLFCSNNKIIKKDWNTFNQLSCKLWFTGDITFQHMESHNFISMAPHLIKMIKDKTSRLEIPQIFMFWVTTPFENLLKLKTFKNIKKIYIQHCRFSDGILEKIFELFPNAEEFTFDCHDSDVYYTSKTSKGIIEHPNFMNLKLFYLYNIDENFDFETFFEAMKESNKTDFGLSFNDNIPEDYKTKLQGFVDEIIEIYPQNSFPPWICFDGIEGADLLRNMRKEYKNNKKSLEA